MFAVLLPTIISWLGSFISGPLISGALTAYQDKLKSEDTEKRIAAELAAKEVDLAIRERELQEQYKVATVGAWYEPDHLMGYAVAVYFGKLLFWDKVLGMGATDPLAGWAETSANLIIAFYFGSSALKTAAKIWTGK
jgi:hypothetical protein